MKKILITGATGFVGNYVVSELLSLGYSVIATSTNKLRALRFKWIGQVKYIEYDFRDFDKNIDYYDFFDRPDLLIHLGWEGLPNYRSLFHFEDNLPRHYEFLKNIIINGCKDVTVAGTCLEYGLDGGILSEDMPSQPSNSYAIAKDCLNRFLNELKKVYPFSFKWVRLFYLYGKGQSPQSLFSQLDSAITNGEPVFNMSGGQQVRDYLPVEVATSYLVKIALQNKVEGVINCCSGKGATVQSIVETYLLKNGMTIKLNLGYYAYPDYEPMYFWGNNSKLQLILNE